MRDPPSLLAGKSCAIRLRSSLGSHGGSAFAPRWEVMRDPPSLLAGKSCALLVSQPPPALFALERRHQQPLDLLDLAIEAIHGPLRADVDDMHIDHPSHLVDLKDDRAR